MNPTFGIVLAPRSGAEWLRSAQDAERQGYRTILLPDTLRTPSPFPTLAAAAAVTSTVRLRPNVIAVPLRNTAATIRETAALQLLSGGRFELGIGSGRPDAQAEAETLGMPWGSAPQRRQQVADLAAAVRERIDPTPTIVVAASGPRMLAAAAEYADRILLAAGPQATEAELADMVRVVRDNTDRAIAFSHQLIGIGDRLPYWTSAQLGLSADALRDVGAAGLLPADPAASAETIELRRKKYGIDEVLIPGELSPDFAPVLTRFTESDK